MYNNCSSLQCALLFPRYRLSSQVRRQCLGKSCFPSTSVFCWGYRLAIRVFFSVLHIIQKNVLGSILPCKGKVSKYCILAFQSRIVVGTPVPKLVARSWTCLKTLRTPKDLQSPLELLTSLIFRSS